MPRYRNLEPTSAFWSWRDQAACIGNDDLFYSAPEELKGERRRKEKEAKAICATCPVLDTCRQFAMESKELYGVWGGLTESERHKLAGRANPSTPYPALHGRASFRRARKRQSARPV